MNPSDQPQRFRVEVTDEATDDMTAAVVAYYPSRQAYRIANADRILSQLLADDPVRNGKYLSEGLYRIIVSPLQVHYEVDPVNRLVRITSIGYFPV